MPDIPKRNFTGGELAPSLHARTDLTKYQSGLAGLRNFFIHPQGGVSNRSGTMFIEEARYDDKESRLIPFEFNKEQAYVLEFGDLYMRVIRNDGLVLEPSVTITGATQANPVVVTATNTYSNGDEVFIDGVVGMTELNSRRYLIANVSGSDFELQDRDGIDIDGTGFTAYVSDGTAARIFTLTTPYVEADIPLLKFTQSADVMTICHPSYEERDLARTDHHVWTLTAISYTPTTATPTGLNVTAGGAGGGSHTKTYEYVVTAVTGDGIESLQSTADSILTTSLDGTHFAQLNWNTVTGATYYNIYKAESETSDVYGWIGESKTLTFRDYNLLPDITDTPAEDRDPFSTSDDYPSTVTYYQQRQVFGRTNNNPQTIFATQSGDFKSMRLSRPTKADDSIERTIASRRVNEIRHFVDLDSLIVLTSGGEWLVTEGQDEVLTPSSAGFKQQTSYGSSHIPPVHVGNSALFVQTGGRRVRDLGYSFQSDSYSGNDVSILAEHLFESRTIREWAYAQEPLGIVWTVMSDGDLLGLTYQKEHQVFGWHRHDTNGFFESVAAIPETSLDAVYFIVRRTINGVTRRYIEKLTDRVFEVAEDAIFVDSCLTYNGVAATSITGLDHLESEAVVALADGNVVSGLTVTNGAVTLPTAASKVHVGLSYIADFETLDFDPNEIKVHGHNTSVSEMDVQILNSRGGFVGPNLDKLEEFKPRRISDSYDPIALRTETIRLFMQPHWTLDGKVFIRQTDPLPMTILSIVPEFSVG